MIIDYLYRRGHLYYYLYLKSLINFENSYIKEGMQDKSIWKQDPEANIWAQEGWEWGVDILTEIN